MTKQNGATFGGEETFVGEGTFEAQMLYRKVCMLDYHSAVDVRLTVGAEDLCTGDPSLQELHGWSSSDSEVAVEDSQSTAAVAAGVHHTVEVEGQDCSHT